MTARAGDVFEIPLSDGRFAYGAVTIGGGAPYIIVLKTVFAARPAVSVLAKDTVALIGRTMDAFFRNGRWPIVEHDYPDRTDIPYPNWKVEIAGKLMITDFRGNPIRPASTDEASLLDFQTSRSPIAFHNAIEALNGLREWLPAYDSSTLTYASQRVLST